MLTVMLARTLKGHFTPDHHFAFEAGTQAELEAKRATLPYEADGIVAKLDRRCDDRPRAIQLGR